MLNEEDTKPVATEDDQKIADDMMNELEALMDPKLKSAS
jgi:hypothetical protein